MLRVRTAFSLLIAISMMAASSLSSAHGSDGCTSNVAGVHMTEAHSHERNHENDHSQEHEHHGHHHDHSHESDHHDHDHDHADEQHHSEHDESHRHACFHFVAIQVNVDSTTNSVFSNATGIFSYSSLISDPHLRGLFRPPRT